MGCGGGGKGCGGCHAESYKFVILRDIRSLAASERSRETDWKLFRGLVILGLEGYSPEELTALFESS